jgi:hypothetical protein
MAQNFTQLDIIRCLYKETSAWETINLMEAMKADVLLLEEYQELESACRQLPKAKFNVRPSVLESIRNYSEQTALNPTS